MARLTPWFPASVKPVRKGVYKRWFRPRVWDFSFWNGERWSLGCKNVSEAKNMRSFASFASDRPWRGLATKPKAPRHG